ncbi:MAG: hypothetical protein CM15mP74_32390 [Halieaceae bacterium]|nr:MAG: hypothetical protein CM15mP74_32390 [Halieaceae bacterium]
MADVLNLPVERFDDCEASGRGAAMVGAAAVVGIPLLKGRVWRWWVRQSV